MKKGFVSARILRDALAVQEGTLFTRACPALRGKGGQETCRCCHAAPETAEHITSACRHWRPSLYVERHDSVAGNLYYVICCRYGITPVHYSNTVSLISENTECRVLWNVDIQTRTSVKHRRPNIVVFDLKRKKILIFDVSIAHSSSLIKQRGIKINRYTVNSNELPDETATSYPPGPNLAADLAVN
uniref:Reverse transcriptase n=1 Tax=Parascaris univalens TaxID=6257 RepID=A0A915AZ55_PARUN